MRQRSTDTGITDRDRLVTLADDVLLRQLALRNHINNERASADPAGYWAPVIILYQQTGDLLHELHQQMLELSPVRFAPVVPALDRQIRAFRTNNDDLETRLTGHPAIADQLIRDMAKLRSGILAIINSET